MDQRRLFLKGVVTISECGGGVAGWKEESMVSWVSERKMRYTSWRSKGYNEIQHWRVLFCYENHIRLYHHLLNGHETGSLLHTHMKWLALWMYSSGGKWMNAYAACSFCTL